MDALSEVLRVVKLDGAVFYQGEFSAPWCFRSPESSHISDCLANPGRHVILYHLLTEGQGYAFVDGAEEQRVSLNAGDIVIFPHGNAHFMGSGSPIKPVDGASELQRVLSQGLSVSRFGGGGEVTKFVCGYMSCEPHLCKVLLGCLPSIIKVSIRNDASGQWLENSIRYSVGDVHAARPGGEAVLAKLSEALFVETLRRYVALLPNEQTGWLAGVRDREVGKALALLHQKPSHPWTIATLAREVGISRSVLAERFRKYLTESPIAYLTRWRMQLGAQLLKSTSQSVLEIAAEVGYESEPAFNRAFKREFRVPPGRFRAAAKSDRAKAVAPSAKKRGSRTLHRRTRAA